MQVSPLLILRRSEIASSLNPPLQHPFLHETDCERSPVQPLHLEIYCALKSLRKMFQRRRPDAIDCVIAENLPIYAKNWLHGSFNANTHLYQKHADLPPPPTRQQRTGVPVMSWSVFSFVVFSTCLQYWNNNMNATLCRQWAVLWLRMISIPRLVTSICVNTSF